MPGKHRAADRGRNNEVLDPQVSRAFNVNYQPMHAAVDTDDNRVVHLSLEAVNATTNCASEQSDESRSGDHSA